MQNVMCVLEWILRGRILPLLLLLEGLNVRIDLIKKLPLGRIGLNGIFYTALTLIKGEGIALVALG